MQLIAAIAGIRSYHYNYHFLFHTFDEMQTFRKHDWLVFVLQKHQVVQHLSVRKRQLRLAWQLKSLALN